MKKKTLQVFIVILVVQLFVIFRGFFISNIIRHTVPAVFTSLGAVSMILLLMFIHFVTKRNMYNRIMTLTREDISRTKGVIQTYETRVKKIYNLYNADDSLNFLDKIIKKEIVVDQLGLDLIKNLEREISNYKSDLFKEEMELLHLKNYSFRIYLWQFLNKKYPDDYYNSLVKNND